MNRNTQYDYRAIGGWLDWLVRFWVSFWVAAFVLSLIARVML